MISFMLLIRGSMLIYDDNFCLRPIIIHSFRNGRIALSIKQVHKYGIHIPKELRQCKRRTEFETALTNVGARPKHTNAHTRACTHVQTRTQTYLLWTTGVWAVNSLARPLPHFFQVPQTPPMGWVYLHLVDSLTPTGTCSP